MSKETKKTSSDVFQVSNELKWEDIDPGVQRQMMGYDDQLMMVKVKFEKGAVGSLHSHYHSQASYIASIVVDTFSPMRATFIELRNLNSKKK